MSLGYKIVGFRPPDKKWKEMKAVYNACKEADVEVPDAVKEFFGGEEPDERGVEVDLAEHGCCKGYRADMQEGYEIEVGRIPEDLTFIRFIISY